MSPSNPLLKVTDLNVYYDSIHAIQGISFEVFPGEIVSLIGANGAGKSSILRALSGLIPSTGEIYFNQENLGPIPAFKRVALGLAQSPEGRGVFSQMSVLENLELGAYSRKDRPQIKNDIERCFSLFERLKERKDQLAGTLSGGEQQMLAICRALMSKPKLLLLDEPSLGLAPLIVAKIFEIIKELNKEGMTVLLVEQNARMALKFSHRAYVLECGQIIHSDKSENLLNDDKIRNAYLGI